MKIAFVYDIIYPYVKGGVEKRVWELAWRLAQRGHEITIFGMKHWDGDDVIYKDGVKLWGVCPPKELYTDGHRSVMESIYFARKVFRPLTKERFDIIDCQNFPYFPCFSAKTASIIRRSKLIITWHEVWGNYWYEYLGKKGFFGKVIERIASHLSSKAIVNSAATERDLRAIGVRKGINLVPSGVDIEKSRKITPSNKSSDVIFSGRLLKEKNVDLLIKAINHVKTSMPNIRCKIIGEGPESDNLQKLIYDLNLEDNICLEKFVENEEQIFSLIKASKVFVLPSKREGLGLTMLEANACGIPTITANYPHNAACDLVVNSENGYICKASEEDLAEKISMVINSDTDWVENCTKFAEQYDWNTIVNAIEEVYRAE